MNPNNSGMGPATPTAGNSEERINVHGTPPAVTRVSRRAVLLVGVFGASLGLVVLMLGFGDHNPPRKDGPADDNAIRPSGPIESVKNLPQDYSFDVTRLGGSYDGLSNRSAAPATGPAGPSAEDRALAQAMRELAEQRRKLLDQQQKEEQAALDSPLLFGGAKPLAASTGTTPTTMPTVVMLGPDSNRADRVECCRQ